MGVKRGFEYTLENNLVSSAEFLRLYVLLYVVRMLFTSKLE